MKKRASTNGKQLIAISHTLSLFLFVISISFIIGQSGIGSAQSIPLPTKVTESNDIEDIKLSESYSLENGESPYQFDSVKKVGDEYFAITPDELFLLENEQIEALIEGGEEVLEPESSLYQYEVPLLGFELEGFTAHLAQGATWALTALGVAKLLGTFGVDTKYTDPLGKAAAAGIFAGKLAWSLFGETAGVTEAGGGLLTGSEGVIGSGISQQTATFIGIGVAVLVFIALYKDQNQQFVHFQCLPYEPPLGGQYCEECNDDPYRPCSEYRCRSLGQACDLVNVGTEDEKCVWINPNDAASPTITPWDEALSADHSYSNHDTRPPSLGTKVTKNGAPEGCLEAFTPLTFGIITNEPAQCKIDSVHTDSFDEMQFFFGETNYFIEEHTQQLNLPSPNALENEGPELQNDGIYDFYVRCRDANGNENVEEFVFNFCVDPSPDTTPPTIVDTSITTGSPVAFDVTSTEIEVYVNEPAECKWSIDDKNYEDMEQTMTCATEASQINAQLLYTCETTLTGIENQEETAYYFRCKDQPGKDDSERNVNVQSYPFSLRGTQPLTILSAGPNETITDNTDVIAVDLTVETSNGANEGQAVCYFSDTGEEGSYVSFFETDSFEHRQTLTLPEGDYTYYFRCVDAGGNADEITTEFKVETDTTAPHITRAYHELDALKIVTDEDATCTYSLNNCNYNIAEGIPLIYSTPSIQTNHFAPWEPNVVYYIKCQDTFGNEPNPDQCSLIASATTII